MHVIPRGTLRTDRVAGTLVVSQAVSGRLQRSSVLHQGQNWTLCSCNATTTGRDTAGFLFFRHSPTETLELPGLDFHFLMCCLSTVRLD